MKLDSIIEARKYPQPGDGRPWTEELIARWCSVNCKTISSYNTWLQQLTLNDDKSVSFKGRIILKDTVERIPFQIRECSGGFKASKKMSTLENCPKIIHGEYAMYSIEGCQLTSLAGLPISFPDGNGQLDMVGIPKIPMLRLCLVTGLTDVEMAVGYYQMYPEKSVRDKRILETILNKYVGKGRSAIAPCQDELIDNGFEWAAKL